MNKTIITLLSIIALGIWINVLQNAGFFPYAQKVQFIEDNNNENDEKEVVPIPVRVVNNPSGMRVWGTVSVDNTVDINLESINGYRNCFYNSYSKHPNDYYRIPIADY